MNKQKNNKTQETEMGKKKKTVLIFQATNEQDCTSKRAEHGDEKETLIAKLNIF